MNILYLSTNAICEEDVLEALQKKGEKVNVWRAPEDAEASQEYAQELIAMMQKYAADMVFALSYIPIVSIVCEAFQKKYAAWVVSDYEPQLYSCTLIYECNYLFLSDYILYEEFHESGFSHVFYLPLAAQSFCIEAGKQKEQKEFKNDLLFLQRVTEREELKDNPFSPESELKDATKGYLEGCIACQYQLPDLPSMAEHLPGYVWEDLSENFPVRVDGQSVETAIHYYDYSIFHELITSADRKIHYQFMKENEYFPKSLHREDYTAEELPGLITESRVNLVITHRNRKSGIPQISWNIMAAGGFLLSNFRMEYLSLFPQEEVRPVLYGHAREMLSRGIYYRNHEEEREALVERIREEVCKHHSYEMRMIELIQRVKVEEDK